MRSLVWSKILRAEPRTPTTVAKGLEAIENARAKPHQLIEDLLDMIRITSGKLRLDIQPVRPAAFIEEACDPVKDRGGHEEIRLERVFDASSCPISGDPVRLKQVCLEPVVECVKFTPHGGRVRVTLERRRLHCDQRGGHGMRG